MKRVLLLLTILLTISIKAWAQVSVIDEIKKIPGANVGLGFSLKEKEFKTMATWDIISWKGINAEAGYSSGAGESGDAIAAVLSYSLINAKQLGVTIPILDLIDFRPGIYYAAGRINKGEIKPDFGAVCSFIKIKF